ncbi:hypothetical protein V8E54_003616 [Elaphomyces granulatus]
MPGQEGEAWEKREEHHPSVLPLSTAPPGRANLSIPSEKVFFLSVLFIITALQRGPDHERAGLEKETSEPPRGKREKADPDAPISACMANIDDSLTGYAYGLYGTLSPEILRKLGAEMRELREMGWAKADEAGKFYSHQGDDTWYYHVYYPPTLTLPAWLRLSTTGKEANMMNWKPAVNGNRATAWKATTGKGANNTFPSEESTTTTSPGILLIGRNREKAGGRDFRSDRVESMRRQDWKSHKETCTGNQKYICFLIHPLMSSSGPESRDMLMDCMEPFHLKSYGNWGAEMRELRERLGWAKADEAGKFYSHQGDDTWYYYVYYPPTLTLPAWLRLSTTGKEANMMVGRQFCAPSAPWKISSSVS